MDAGLLVLRALLAAVLFAHATQKLGGWFGGPGRAKSSEMFAALGHRPAALMVTLAGSAEFTAAFLLISGLLSPLAAAMTMVVMLVAGLSMTQFKGRLWNSVGGGEYPLVLAGTGAVVALTGPGAWSLDAVLDAAWYAPAGSSVFVLAGPGAILGAAVAASVPVLRARRQMNIDRV